RLNLCELGKLFYTVLFSTLIFISEICFVLNLGCQAGLEYAQPLPAGDFAPCEPCWLGRGKCRKMCTEDEKVVGNCKVNFFCCRRRI
uniref:Beta-defensin n=1 Tax=Sus scrofa TaxID=9823 RepID=A0A8D1UI02_PIG